VVGLKDKLLRLKVRPVSQVDSDADFAQTSLTLAGFDTEANVQRRRRPMEDKGWGRSFGPEVYWALKSLFRLESPPVQAFSGWLFLDTETTGLGFGASTFAFLVGIAFWDGQTWVVEQFFVRSPADEAEMLRKLAERFSDVHTLVTFNGKSYDLPLINHRLKMHQLAQFRPS